MYGCLYSLSRLSIRELPIKKFFRFQRGVNIDPLPHAPLHNIHPVMVMVAVKLKLLYTLGPTLPELSILIECVGLFSLH